MTKTLVVGVDPGLVHTGVVGLIFDLDNHRIVRTAHAVAGPNTDEVRKWIFAMQQAHNVRGANVYTFVEDYKPRSHFNTDSEMTKVVHEMRQLPYAKVLSNEGVKKIVRRKLMELLECWDFKLPTHHQDLRSAARIGIMGMLKDELLNELLTMVVHDYVEGAGWDVLIRQ